MNGYTNYTNVEEHNADINWLLSGSSYGHYSWPEEAVDIYKRYLNANKYWSVWFEKPDENNKKETKMDKKFYVTDVITHNNKVVIVKFSDGTFTKSVCSDNDTFDIDVGISICLLKRLLCGEGKAEDANRNYNNLIRKIHKKMAKKEADKAEALKAKKERRDKQAAKERKNEARKNKEREEFVEDIYKGVKKAVLLLKEEDGE